jgi:hypothetical protein
MSVMGLVTITAPYLPLILIAYSYLANGGFDAAIADIVRSFPPFSSSAGQEAD